MTLRYGVAALARPTFDVPYAEQMKERAFAALARAGIAAVGPRTLLFDRAAAESALREIAASEPIDLMLILQITFTDATMTVEIARRSAVPVALWAVPEPRAGGRLRLNAYCGLNLAAHALGRAGIQPPWMYADPEAASVPDDLRRLCTARAPANAPVGDRGEPPRPRDHAAADRALAALRGAQVTVIGTHPEGFHTCEFDADLVRRLAGVGVRKVELGTVFDRARAADGARVAAVRRAVAAGLSGLEALDQDQLDRSLRVYCALEDVQHETAAQALAVRCWPEMFTEYGCAACGPMAMMNGQRVPSACEADVQGAITQLLLQTLADEPAWMADLVDIRASDDTAVFWHCGLAPLSMRDPEAEAQATIHTNRRMPLLHQFPIRPGRITLARLSRARNEVKLMIAGAEVIRAPMPFTGCSGTVRFDRPAAEVGRTIIDEGLEHHYAIAYGDHRPALRAVAERWNVPVLELA